MALCVPLLTSLITHMHTQLAYIQWLVYLFYWKMPVRWLDSYTLLIIIFIAHMHTQLAYIQWLASYTHSIGLLIGLKNTGESVRRTFFFPPTFLTGVLSKKVALKYFNSKSIYTYITMKKCIFLLKERSDGGGTISRLFECLYVCPSVTNDVVNITVTRSS